MKHVIEQLVSSALDKAKKNGDLEIAEEPEIVIEKPKDAKLGDFSTNLAMILAKSERKNPRVIAEVICKYLKNGGEQVERVERAREARHADEAVGDCSSGRTRGRGRSE